MRAIWFIDTFICNSCIIQIFAFNISDIKNVIVLIDDCIEYQISIGLTLISVGDMAFFDYDFIAAVEHPRVIEQ